MFEQRESSEGPAWFKDEPPFFFTEEERMEAGAVLGVGAIVLLGITFTFMFQKFHSNRK